MKYPEPKITIIGVLLHDRHAMTIRVALTNFMSDLCENGLGDDETGIGICEGYKRAIRDMQGLMVTDDKENK